MNFVLCVECGTEIFVFCCLQEGIVEGYCKDCLLTLDPTNKACSLCRTNICKKIEHMQSRLRNNHKPNTSGRGHRHPQQKYLRKYEEIWRPIGKIGNMDIPRSSSPKFPPSQNNRKCSHIVITRSVSVGEYQKATLHRIAEQIGGRK